MPTTLKFYCKERCICRMPVTLQTKPCLLLTFALCFVIKVFRGYKLDALLDALLRRQAGLLLHELPRMRAIFSILGLLLVLAMVGILAKKQLGGVPNAVSTPPDSAHILVSTAASGATAQQQSQQIQQQIKQSVEATLQQARPVPDEQ